MGPDIVDMSAVLKQRPASSAHTAQLVRAGMFGMIELPQITTTGVCGVADVRVLDPRHAGRSIADV